MMKRLICILSVAALVCLCQPVKAETTEQTQTVAKDRSAESAARWVDTMAQFRKWDTKNTFPKDAVLFVGSSSIVGWPTRECFPDLPVINRGFGGSIYSDITCYVDTVIFPYNPKLIVFYSGDNDPFWGKSADQIISDFHQLVSLVHEKYPTTPIIVMATKICQSRIDRADEYRKANAMLEKTADSDKLLYYFDSVSPLLDKDGNPNNDLFIGDHLHLNPKGYAIWSDKIRPLIDKLISSDK